MSTLKRISLEYMGRKIKFWMVNAELVEELTKFRTTSKPHFLCFKDGEQLEVVEGVNAPALFKIVADHIPDGMLLSVEHAIRYVV